MIRPETSHDFAAICAVHVAAFLHHPYSMQTEHVIVEALRAAGALEISLVADLEGNVVGHIAFSGARVGAVSAGWYLLGPVAVLPDYQRRGVGRALIEAGLGELRARRALGCVLVGLDESAACPTNGHGCVVKGADRRSIMRMRALHV